MTIGNLSRLSLLASIFFLTLTLAVWNPFDVPGRRMRNGQPFDPEKFTVAANFNLGTPLVVSANGREVVVIVTEYGPDHTVVNAGWDMVLSKAAWRALGLPDGHALEVDVRPLYFEEKKN